MKYLYTKLASAVMAMALLMPAQAAQQVGGISFEDTLQVAQQPLVLNGAGLRVKMIIKVYAIGLYVGKRDASPERLIAQPGPKSLRIVMLRTVTAEQLIESLITGIEDNSSAAERSALKARMDVLKSSMMRIGKANKGDVIQLDYVPGVGTRITLGGKPVTPDLAGDDFYAAIMRIWLGSEPSDSSLKQALLGMA